MSTMAVWIDQDATGDRDTAPPPASSGPTHLLARLLPLAAERLTEAAAALLKLDDQVDKHATGPLDREQLAEDRRTAAFAVSTAFEAVESVVDEVARLALQQDLEEWQLSDALGEIGLMASRTAEGLSEHRLWERVARMKGMASAMRSWAAELDAPLEPPC